MILFDRVNFRYNEKKETSFSLKEVSFSCQKGSINGIIGGNGSGKSTIARLITGLIAQQDGEITVDGFAPFTHVSNCGFLAGIIFQTPDNQIVGTTVAEDLAFGLENLGIEPKEMRLRVNEVANKFGLFDLLDTPVHRLSGGQKQMLCIASVIVMQPAWIIFDEPTSHLDPWARLMFWQVVSDLAQAKQIGVIVVSQLPEDLEHFSKILCFESGELVFSGSIEQFKESSASFPWFETPESWKFEKLLELSR